MERIPDSSGLTPWAGIHHLDEEMADLMIEILKEIRDAVRHNGDRIDRTNERLDQTNERLDQTNERLDQTNQKLSVLATITKGIDTRMGRVETRLDRIESHEPDRLFLPQRVSALESRVEQLEEAKRSG